MRVLKIVVQVFLIVSLIWGIRNITEYIIYDWNNDQASWIPIGILGGVGFIWILYDRVKALRTLLKGGEASWI